MNQRARTIGRIQIPFQIRLNDPDQLSCARSDRLDLQQHAFMLDFKRWSSLLLDSLQHLLQRHDRIQSHWGSPPPLRYPPLGKLP